MNISEIIQLKFPQLDFRKDVILQDDGKGPYIKKWDSSLGPKPDQAMLDAWAIEGQHQMVQQHARQRQGSNNGHTRGSRQAAQVGQPDQKGRIQAHADAERKVLWAETGAGADAGPHDR